MDAKKVGKNIALLRKENNMTQKELAAKLNVIDKTISRWECGYGLPDIATLPKIAEVFNVSIEMLIGEDEKVYSDEAQSQSPSAAKKTFPLAIVLSIILIVAVIAATASVITISAGKPKREISAYCWDVAFQSDADYVFITAFGNDEVMSLELYEGSDYFVCQETWVESEEAKFLNCAVEGSYKVEGNTVYFYPDYVIDPDGTAKLRTHKILGLEDFHAEIVSGTEGYESVIFYADAKNTSTSVFGRWTKFANYYSRSESEVYFERVRGSRLTYMQQVKLPVFAPYIQFILALSAFMFYVYGVYYYVSVVLVGIDLDSFSAQCIICSALFALTTIASAVGVFLKQTKTDAKEQTE